MVDQEWCCLNDPEVPTYYSATHSSFSTIDLSFCSLSLVDSVNWMVLEDSYTSDHYPIHITFPENAPTPRPPKFNWSKADWSKFHHCTNTIPAFQTDVDHNTMFETFSSFTLDATCKSVPLVHPHPNRREVP